jgi:thioredoxin reductase (NADPH)
MSNPVIMAIDRDPAALRDLERELLGRYANDYRIVCSGAPSEALESLRRLADRGDEVALVLAGQWLSETTGSELLERVRQFHPHAKRGLLVDWGDWGHRPTAEAILDSMALGRIDYYLLRPAGSPDEVFHQAISGFLVEWARAQRTAPHAAWVVAASWSGRAYELRRSFSAALPPTFSAWPTRSRDGPWSPRQVLTSSFRSWPFRMVSCWPTQRTLRSRRPRGQPSIPSTTTSVW